MSIVGAEDRRRPRQTHSLPDHRHPDQGGVVPGGYRQPPQRRGSPQPLRRRREAGTPRGQLVIKTAYCQISLLSSIYGMFL